MNDETQHALPPPATDPAAPGAETAPDAPAAGLYPETIAQTPSQVDRASAAVPLSVKVVVPGYTILGELGRGGMGVVYKARHLKLNRIVALKMVLGAQHADPRELARFHGEAQVVAAIRHPNVIQVFDSGEADGCPFMAMECLEGGTLSQRLRAGGKMAPPAAAGLLVKIARGVQAAHDRGIVHRDIKPHNVLLDAPPPNAPPGAWGEPKVMDFGLAKSAGAVLTQTGAVMGTPAYMAPEQAKGETKNIGPAADVYALGVILYECLCGSVPFAGSDAWSVIRQVMCDEPEPVTRRIRGVPRDLDLICRKCLAKEPRERYASAAALADDLQRFLNGEAIRGPRTGVWYAGRQALRRRWRRAAAVGALVALVVATWAVTSKLHKSGRPEAPGEERENEVTAALRVEVTDQVVEHRRTRPAPDRVSPHRVESRPDLPVPDFSNFKARRDERVVDMRGWRPGDDSSVTFGHVREFTKLAPADAMRIETRTTGREIVNKVERPNPAKALVLLTDKPAVVGDRPGKVSQIVFDVSDIAVGGTFALRFTSTHWNAFQTDQDQWVGVTGYRGAVKTAVLMLFPEGRPFRDYQVRYSPERGAALQPYTGPLITLTAEDKSWLYWQIPAPKEYHFYRVEWTW